MPTMRMLPEYGTASGTLYGVNVLNFISLGGDFDQSTVNDIAGLWASFKANSLNAKCTFFGSTRFLDDCFEPLNELIADNVDEVAGSAGELAPVNCAYKVNLVAGAGRRRRGRIFLPGVDEGKIDDGGELQGTTAADIVGNLLTFIEDCAIDHGWLLGVRSGLDAVVRGVSGISVGTFVGTQRRRIYALQG